MSESHSDGADLLAARLTPGAEELGESVDALRAELVAQDHRILPTLRRFFWDRKTWPADDPRHRAVKLALVHQLFFSPTSFALGGAVIAVLTWATLIQQNGLLHQQIVREQEQSQLYRLQWAQEREVEYLKVLTSSDADRLPKSLRTASAEGLFGLSKTLGSRTYSDLALSGLGLAGVHFSGLRLTASNIQNTNCVACRADMGSRFWLEPGSSLHWSSSVLSETALLTIGRLPSVDETGELPATALSIADSHLSNTSLMFEYPQSRLYLSNSCMEGDNEISPIARSTTVRLSHLVGTRFYHLGNRDRLTMRIEQSVLDSVFVSDLDDRPFDEWLQLKENALIDVTFGWPTSDRGRSAAIFRRRLLEDGNCGTAQLRLPSGETLAIELKPCDFIRSLCATLPEALAAIGRGRPEATDRHFASELALYPVQPTVAPGSSGAAEVPTERE